MQTRRMIIALFAAMAVFYLWLIVSRFIFDAPTQPPEQTTTEQRTVDRDGQGDVATRPGGTSTAPGVTTGPAPAVAEGLNVVEGESEEPIFLGAAIADSPYPMKVVIQPRGATVSRIELRGHYETVEKEDPYRIVDPVKLSREADETRTARSFASRINIEGIDLSRTAEWRLWHESVWKIAERTDERVVLSLEVHTAAGEPLARLTKTYELRPQPRGARTYDLQLSFSVENLTDRPLKTILSQQGPIGFNKEDPRGEDRNIIAATWDGEDINTETKQRGNIFKANIGRQQLAADEDDERIAWVAEGNKYFACIMAPAGRNSGDVPPLFKSVDATHFTKIEDEGANGRQDLTFEFVSRQFTLGPGETKALEFDCYVGPKSRKNLKNVPAYIQRNYYRVVSEGFACCTFPSLVNMMMWLINAVHSVWPHNYGIAIIVLVLVVRAALHPITKKGQINMIKMQKNQAKLQPKIQAIREKYGNDRMKINQATMELYKEENINPTAGMMSCLPMMLQMPIWVALWTALGYTIDMRHAPFDGYWINDLTAPDALIDFSWEFTIPLIGGAMGPITSLNLLPILLGISQMLQARFMPRGTPSQQNSRTPDQLEQQRKMMMFVSVAFVFILYNAPSGLTLYIMSSNVFGILEQWRIRKHLAEAEARGEFEPTKPEKSGPSWFETTWLGGVWSRFKKGIGHRFEQLQKEAEEAKKVQNPKQKQKKKKR